MVVVIVVVIAAFVAVVVVCCCQCVRNELFGALAPNQTVKRSDRQANGHEINTKPAAHLPHR